MEEVLQKLQEMEKQIRDLNLKVEEYNSRLEATENFIYDRKPESSNQNPSDPPETLSDVIKNTVKVEVEKYFQEQKKILDEHQQRLSKLEKEIMDIRLLIDELPNRISQMLEDKMKSKGEDEDKQKVVKISSQPVLQSIPPPKFVYEPKKKIDTSITQDMAAEFDKLLARYATPEKYFHEASLSDETLFNIWKLSYELLEKDRNKEINGPLLIWYARRYNNYPRKYLPLVVYQRTFKYFPNEGPFEYTGITEEEQMVWEEFLSKLTLEQHQKYVPNLLIGAAPPEK
ncbi:MAG: hypothetical protein QXQ77_02640 [Candidatus Aenigmatarchaeota archaeon]